MLGKKFRGRFLWYSVVGRLVGFDCVVSLVVVVCIVGRLVGLVCDCL